MKRLFMGLLVVLLVAAGVAVALISTGGPLADIRPSVITVAAQPDREARGRALLASMLEAHGGAEGFTASPVRSFDFEDEWVGLPAMMTSWPEPFVRGRVTQRSHSFESRIDFTDGSRAGDSWGVSDGQPWETTAGVVSHADNPKIAFALPTAHYFLELPLRMTEAGVVRYVGSETVRGVAYEVVFLSWGSVEASPDVDQYLVYIEAETGRVGLVHFTVRDAMRMAVGTAHYLDQEQLGGMWLATRIPITAKVGDDPAHYMHEMRFSNFTFDAAELAHLSAPR